MLSLAQHDRISKCVGDVLGSAVKSALLQTDYKTAEGEAVCLRQATIALLGAVQKEVTVFNQKWNVAHPDAVLSLPRELAGACFRYLDFQDRVAASHVSRAWRSATVSDAGLWHTLVLANPTRAQAADLFTTMLRRSDPMPFSLTVRHDPKLRAGYHDIWERFFDLLLEEISRMASLNFGLLPSCTVARLFALRVPSLRRLRFAAETTRGGTIEDHICALPSNWGSGHAPNLHSLEAGVFLLPSHFEPMTSLRSFSGIVPEDNISYSAFFQLFPQLTSLDLGRVPENALLGLLAHMSPSITTVRLNKSLLSCVDYSDFLRAFGKRRWTSIQLGGAATISAGVQLLAETTAGEWQLAAEWPGMVTATGLADGLCGQFSVARAGQLRLDRDCDFLRSPAIARLAALELPLGDMLRLFSSRTWDRALPGLRALAVSLQDVYRISDIRASAVAAATAAPIAAPQLATIRLDTSFPEDRVAAAAGTRRGVSVEDKDVSAQCASWVARRAPALIHRLFSLSAGRLQLFVVEMAEPESLVKADLQALQGMAHRMLVKKARTHEEFELFNDLD